MRGERTEAQRPGIEQRPHRCASRVSLDHGVAAVVKRAHVEVRGGARRRRRGRRRVERCQPEPARARMRGRPELGIVEPPSHGLERGPGAILPLLAEREGAPLVVVPHRKQPPLGPARHLQEFGRRGRGARWSRASAPRPPNAPTPPPRWQSRGRSADRRRPARASCRRGRSAPGSPGRSCPGPSATTRRPWDGTGARARPPPPPPPRRCGGCWPTSSASRAGARARSDAPRLR